MLSTLILKDVWFKELLFFNFYFLCQSIAEKKKKKMMMTPIGKKKSTK